MQIRFSPNISDYMEKVEHLLIKKEACNHLLLGLMNYYQTTISKDIYLGYIMENSSLQYAFMQTPLNQWILADIDHVDEQMIRNLAQFLYTRGMKVPGIQGPTSVAEIFVKEWLPLKKTRAKLYKKELVYRLDKQEKTIYTTDKLMKATIKEHELVRKWLIHFGKETNEIITDIRASHMATKYIENGSLYFWLVDGEPVSMANQSQKTKHGVTINAVYTPDAQKGKGYATNLVATLSQKLLDEGNAFCCLLADKENPTSNYVYQKIGYQVVGESVVYRFG